MSTTTTSHLIEGALGGGGKSPLMPTVRTERLHYERGRCAKFRFVSPGLLEYLKSEVRIPFMCAHLEMVSPPFLKRTDVRKTVVGEL